MQPVNLTSEAGKLHRTNSTVEGGLSARLLDKELTETDSLQPRSASALDTIRSWRPSMADSRWAAFMLAGTAAGLLITANVSDSTGAQQAGKLAPNVLIASFACLAAANLFHSRLLTRIFSTSSMSAFLLAIVAYNLVQQKTWPAASVTVFEALGVMAFAGMALSIVHGMKQEVQAATQRLRRVFLAMGGLIATGALGFGAYNWDRKQPESSRNIAISNDLIPLSFSWIITVVHSLISSLATAPGHDGRHTAARWLTGLALTGIVTVAIMTLMEDAQALSTNVSKWMDVLIAAVTALMGVGERLGFSPLATRSATSDLKPVVLERENTYMRVFEQAQTGASNSPQNAHSGLNGVPEAGTRVAPPSSDSVAERSV